MQYKQLYFPEVQQWMNEESVRERRYKSLDVDAIVILGFGLTSLAGMVADILMPAQGHIHFDWSLLFK